MPGDRHSRADSPTPAGDRPTLSPARPGDIVESANGEGVVAQAAGPRPPARSQALHNAVQRWGPVIWLVLLGGLIGTFMVHEREHIAQLGTVLGGARLPWVLAAGVLEVLYLVLIGKTYQAVLTRLGQDIELWPVLEAYLRSHAVGSVVPFSGPTTAVLFIRYLTRARVPGALALLATGLTSLVGYASFVIVLPPALLALWLERELAQRVVAAALLSVFLFAILTAAMFLVLRGPPPPDWLTRRIPRWLRRSVEEIRTRRIGVRELLRPLALAVATDVVGVAILYAALGAVGRPGAVVAALVSYQLEMLFNVVAPFFQGVGLVEVSMTLALEAMQIPLATALAATLIYRLWDLWVPILAGLALEARGRWREVNRREGRPPG